MSTVDEIRAQAQEVAAGWAPPDAPESWQLTAALFGVIAAHEALLQRLAELPSDRLPALLASAAVSFLVRRDRPMPLAGYFPEPGGPQPGFDAGFFPAARSFVSARLDDVSAICRERRYQMNEVARCAQIALGIAATASPEAPVALVNLGTGAGLGLQLDRYRYLVGTRSSGPRAAALTLSCEARGSHLCRGPGFRPSPNGPGSTSAPSTWRTARPGRGCRRARRRKRPRWPGWTRPSRRPGCTLSTSFPATWWTCCPAFWTAFRAGREVIVTDAYLAVFLPPERRARLVGILAAAGRGRRVTWLSLDPLVPLGPSGRDSVQGLALPAQLVRDYQRHGVFAALGARTFDHGAESGRLLARAHPSGQWIEWLSPDAA